ncbi:hypothetical protein XELAEV_18001764mg [Xenopus laevis]|uniref:Uncharacterized protein n=1 Tax=Xenopus laevis TaxID=8355 RepID=A0A974BQB7_XENLA|nr:hypothetical protein XELAEV_18001764mg [Xenopus laevis]
MQNTQCFCLIQGALFSVCVFTIGNPLVNPVQVKGELQMQLFGFSCISHYYLCSHRKYGFFMLLCKSCWPVVCKYYLLVATFWLLGV